MDRTQSLFADCPAHTAHLFAGHLLRGQGNSVIVGELTITKDGGEVTGVSFLPTALRG